MNPRVPRSARAPAKPARPVLGMLDWGIGGCSVLAALQAQGVDCEVLYASDSGSLPYGTLTSQALRARVQRVAKALMAQGAEQVVVACNAASTVCAEISRCAAAPWVGRTIDGSAAHVPSSVAA